MELGVYLSHILGFFFLCKLTSFFLGWGGDGGWCKALIRKGVLAGLILFLLKKTLLYACFVLMWLSACINDNGFSECFCLAEGIALVEVIWLIPSDWVIMRSIKPLPEAVHSSVRSGIILFDLTRVVEELIYNSLDAGATKVINSCYLIDQLLYLAG